MDERFEDPTESEEQADPEAQNQSNPADDERAAETVRQQTTTNQTDTARSTQSEEEPLNIREDWDSATIYVEPRQSEDIEIFYTRLKKQLQREGHVVEKNKHFYHAVFEIAFEEYREETKQKIRELVIEESDPPMA